MQEEVGLRSATDGEFRRTSWHMDFIYQLGGIDPADEKLTVQFFNEEGALEFTAAALRVHDRITLQETIFGDAFAFLQTQRRPRATPKLTIPSPSMVHYRGGRAAIDAGGLPRPGPVLGRPERRLRRAGAPAGRAGLHVPAVRRHQPGLPQRPAPAGADGRPGRRRRAPARALHRARSTQALAGRPAGLTVTTHMCRGNFRSSWAAEGGYDFVAEALFTRAGRRRLLPGVRRRALRRLRAAAVRPARQEGRARPGHHQARRSWRARTTSSAASTRPPATCRWSSCACRRSAASPPPWRATR